MRIIALLLLLTAASYACSSASAPPAKQPTLVTVKLISGASQQAAVGTALPSPIVIQALDSAGHPLAGLNVAYGPSAGSANPSTGKTDSTGKASTSWTLGTSAGQESLLATVFQGNPGTVILTDTVYATATP